MNGAAIEVPERLGWLRATPSGADWLRSLPELVADVAEHWSLRPGPPFPNGYASWAAPAVQSDGTPVVVKVQYPHDDCREEAAALRDWRGDGAVRLLDHDPDHHALLLERCLPGHPLAGRSPTEALDVLVGLLPRLWISLADDAPYDHLADVAAGWAANLPGRWRAAGRPGEERLVDAAVALATELAADLARRAVPLVLVNQDLHGDNVLSAEREPWLVIDPKPLAGEAASGVAPVVRSFELGHSRAAVHHRLDRLTSELDVDRERARGWTIAQTVAWAVDADAVVQAHHLATASWLLDG